MPAWPASLPQCPILNAFSERRQRNVVSFVPEVGKPKMRRRSTAATVVTQCAFRMTTTQLNVFDGFYVDDIDDGSLPFTWAHPISKVTKNWIFQAGESPTYERFAPARWRVSFTLIRLD